MVGEGGAKPDSNGICRLSTSAAIGATKEATQITQVITKIPGTNVSSYDQGFAVDTNKAKIYWIECRPVDSILKDACTSFGVKRANLDGSQVEDILESAASGAIIYPKDLAIDMKNRHLYIADAGADHNQPNGGGRILRINLVYFERQEPVLVELVADNLPGSPTGIALDTVTQRVYWVSRVPTPES